VQQHLPIICVADARTLSQTILLNRKYPKRARHLALTFAELTL